MDFFNIKEEQNQYWMIETINEQLKTQFYNHPIIEKALLLTKQKVINNEISPFSGAIELLQLYKNVKFVLHVEIYLDQ